MMESHFCMFCFGGTLVCLGAKLFDLVRCVCHQPHQILIQTILDILFRFPDSA